MAPAAAEVVTISSSPASNVTPSSQLSFKSAESSVSCLSASGSDVRPTEYRSVKTLPFELQEHCAIYLEEGLCTLLPGFNAPSLMFLLDSQALNFLISLVTAGSASSTPCPALLPPPQFLRLISTLTVHPTLNTRAKSADRLQAANLAHCYLRLVLKLAGPIRSNLAEAFRYAGIGGRQVGKRRSNGTSPSKDSASSIENDLANSAAVFTRAENFWQVVGWAFNCSILYHRRWERWSLWLEYMTEALETDWEMRIQPDEMEQSLIVQYIISGGGESDSGRKIIRAIFADGRKVSVGEWKEVWHNEAIDLRANGDVKRAEKAIKIEEDDYGDYASEEDDEFFEHDSSQSIAQQTAQTPSTDTSNATDSFGGTIALNLRVRLLSLLSQVANKHSQCFSSSTRQCISGTERLYGLILEHVRPLALPEFFLFISPSTLRSWSPHAVCVFTQYVLHRSALIDGAAPEPDSYMLTDKSLLKSHLPWASSKNGVVDNAKVSICVENLMRLFDRYGPGLTWTQDLEDLAELGIRRREDKAKLAHMKGGRKRKRGTAATDDSEEWAYLRESTARIRLLLHLVKENSLASQRTRES